MRYFGKYNENGKYIAFYTTDIWDINDIPKDNVIELTKKQWSEGISGKYYVVDGIHTKYVPTQSEKNEKKLQAIRRQRNHLLRESDWTQIPNNPLSQQKQEEWKVYRQELRDVTNSIPYELPTPPAE